ncbi:endonuclease domain-containing 1 protein-like [Chanos chanos]|uniref:Endonuclease domain-containing 1 protein-like n=1 Tax=Chanos chanos TaxID=29144 RepID=A0A6J2VT51_CHACN|nr:endonuclease domain-containing 1 protein-like [Chanos chanos]
MSFSSILLTLSFFFVSIHSSIDPSFRSCAHFFYRQMAPRGARAQGLRPVCQLYRGQPMYATLYDQTRRMPFYSAYIFRGSDGMKMNMFPWMYEPQLFRASETGNMQPFPPAGADQRLEESQAVLADYTNAVAYERGQLNPDQHQSSPAAKAATYTLTNVVPMAKDFLQNHWDPYLDTIRQRLNIYCRSTAYVISGITTTGRTLLRPNARGLTVPKHVWLAYCCPDFDPGMPYSLRYKFPSYAAYGLNEVYDNFVSEVSSKSLEALVKTEMPVDQNFQLFDGNCVGES